MSLPDYRLRVAETRRRKMRARLIEAALLTVATRGLDSAMIEDIIAEAGVSRGSFYNHFFALRDLLHAASDELATEMVGFVRAGTPDQADPAQRVAQGIAAFLATARAYPLLAQFTARMGMEALGPGSIAEEVLAPVLQAGMAAGRFRPMPPAVAQDLIAAALLASMARQARGETVAVPALIEALLRVLGLAGDEAARLAALPAAPAEAPADSLVARTEAIRQARLARPAPRPAAPSSP